MLQGIDVSLLSILFYVLFPPLIEGGTTHIPATVIRAATLVFAASLLVRRARGDSLRLDRARIFTPVAAFLLAAAFSYIIAPYKYLAWQRLVSIINWALVLFVAFHAFREKKHIRAFILLAASMAVAEAAAGIVQIYLYHVSRAKGTFFNTDFFGSYAAMSVPLLIHLAVDGKGRAVKAASGIGLAAAVCGLMLTQSRGAFLALAAAVFVFASIRYRWKGAALAVAAACVVFLAAPGLKERTFQGTKADPFAYYRVHIWKNAAERAVARPWGEGLGNYQLGTQRMNFPAPDGPVRYAKVAESAHNGYLQVAVEMGVQGLLILLWGLYLTFGAVRKALRDPDVRPEAAALAAGLSAFLAHSLVDSTFMEPALVILSLLMAAALFRLSGDGREVSVGIRNPRLFRYGAAALAGVLIVHVSLPLFGWLCHGRYRKTGDTAYLEKAVTFAPGSAAYRSSLAAARFAEYARSRDKGALEDARSEMEEAVRLSPEDSEHYARMGMLLAADASGDRGEKKRALLEVSLNWYLKAIARNKYNAFNYLEAARLQARLGRADEAAGLLARALEYEPDFLPGRLELARLLAASGRRGEALAQLEAIDVAREKYPANALKQKRYDVDPAELERLRDRLAH